MDRAESYILLVEDDVDTGMILGEILHDAGRSTVHVTSGRDALDHLASPPPPSLVLLDGWMPDMSGIEVLIAYRAAGGEAPVVLMSGDDRVGVEGAAEGAAGFLAKPPDLDALLALVERFCGKASG